MSLFTSIRPTSKLALAVAASLAVAVLTVLPTRPGSADAAPASARPKPTIVLEHGAWADASSWAGVIRRLQQKGYTVEAPPNPLRGVPNDSANLADFLQTISGPIVLVGHSYGGMVITNAVAGNPQVKALVYIDAFIPDQGETLLQLVSAQPGSCLGGDPTSVFNFAPYPGAPAKDVDLYVKPDLFPNCFANGLPAAEGTVLASTQRPLALSSISEPSGVPAWKTIPSWSLVGTADKAIPPAEQLVMSKRANAHITEVLAPHMAMISRPDAVTAMITQAAQAGD